MPRPAAVSAELIEALKQLLGTGGWTDDPVDISPHLAEPRGLFHGQTPLVVKPNSTDQVSEILTLCHRADIAVVPQGGNTGRCGGAVPHETGNEILLNLNRMNRILQVDPLDYSITVEAGVILKSIQEAAIAEDLLFPLSLGAEGSCQIGGNLATNAGGLNVIGYGNARDLVLGLEVVLADGQVWNGLKSLRKDNTGYDLKNLMIGSEGTLGIITKAVLKLFPAPKDRATALVALPSPELALELLARARKMSGDAITAFEIMSAFALKTAVDHIPGCTAPFEASSPWTVLMELTSARADGGLSGCLEDLLEECLTGELISDAVIATSVTQRNQLWRLRESIPDAQKFEGASIKHDVSVPVSRVAEFLNEAIPAVQAVIPGVRPCPFGHLGDGNIHFNLTQPVGADPQSFLRKWQEVNKVVHDIVTEKDGSISAEHGIGRLKVDELAHYSDPVKLQMLEQIKRSLDPTNILNPGKIVRNWR